MDVLRVCFLLCLLLVIANPEEGEEIRKGGRSRGKNKKLVKGHAKKRSRIVNVSVQETFISSYNISSSVRGIICRNSECRQYWPESSQSVLQGIPKWVMTVKNIQYFCFSEEVKQCPRFEGGNYKRYKGKEYYKRNKNMKNFQMIVCGKIYLCRAPHRRLCPDVPIIEAKWKQIVSGKAYIRQNGSLIIVCIDSDIEKCYEKYGSGGWVIEKNELEFEGVVWFIVTEGIKYYCKEKKKGNCPSIEGSGGEEWKRYCKGSDVEECAKDGQWELEVRGVVIICRAHDIDDCKEIHRGDWVPSKREKGKDGKPKDARWVSEGGGADVFCTADSFRKCPKLKKGGGAWNPVGEDSDYPETEASQWERKIGGATIICVADDKKDCEKIRKGRWDESERCIYDDGVPEDTYWLIIIGHVKVYCDKKSKSKCPKLVKGGASWKPVGEREPQGPNGSNGSEDEDGKGVWERHWSGVVIICVAVNVKDCKKVHKGHWGKSGRGTDDNGVPEGANWVIIINDAKVYCYAKSKKKCPKLEKGGRKWKEVEEDKPNEPDEPQNSYWQMEIGVVVIICAAGDVKDCKKIRQGHWKSCDRERCDGGHPKNVGWMVIIGTVTGYCDAKNVKKCPKLKGGRIWGPLDGKPSHHRTEGDGRDVDVSVIVPELTGGMRFRQPQGDDTVILCYSEDKKKCPKGGKWVKTKENAVGEKLNHVITGINIWVIVIEKAHVVCVAEEVTSCKGGDGWYVIGGMKASLWQTVYKEVVMYCETAVEDSCPDGIGDWALVSHDQWSQTKLPLKKKGQMWRIVTFKATVHCDAEYAGKCPKVKGHKWHKIFGNEIDFSAFGKEVNYEMTIGKTYYCCKAKSKDACPDLPGDASWGKVKKKLTLEVLLIFFEDIDGFKHACTSGICHLKKGQKIDDDDFDRRSKHKNTKKHTHKKIQKKHKGKHKRNKHT